MTVETASFIADATPIYTEVLAEVGRPVLPRQTFERCVAEAAEPAVREVCLEHLDKTEAES